MELKIKRSLSGIWLRFKRPDGIFENRCFEDLPEENQEKFMDSLDTTQLKQLCKHLAIIINRIAEATDISNESDEE